MTADRRGAPTGFQDPRRPLPPQDFSLASTFGRTDDRVARAEDVARPSPRGNLAPIGGMPVNDATRGLDPRDANYVGGARSRFDDRYGSRRGSSYGYGRASTTTDGYEYGELRSERAPRDPYSRSTRDLRGGATSSEPSATIRRGEEDAERR